MGHHVIKMPDIGEGIAEVEVIAWKVEVGGTVAEDQVVAEVMQETYLAVWRAAGSFAGAAVSGSAAGWLWTIAARRLVDAFRRRARDAESNARCTYGHA